MTRKDRSATGAPQCAICGRRHFGRCSQFTGQCYKCGRFGHRMAQCVVRDTAEVRSESRPEQRSDRRPGTAGSSRAFGEGSIIKNPSDVLLVCGSSFFKTKMNDSITTDT